MDQTAGTGPTRLPGHRGRVPCKLCRPAELCRKVEGSPMNLNYYETLIAVADDCPVHTANPHLAEAP